MLVSLEIAHVLRDAGFEVLGPAHSIAPALSIIKENGCEVAVLNINLGGGETSKSVARPMLANGMRLLTLSGYSREQHPQRSTALPPLRNRFAPMFSSRRSRNACRTCKSVTATRAVECFLDWYLVFMSTYSARKIASLF